jgi:acetyl-CoA C-acetyltransferase
LNEAFASQALACMRELSVPVDRANANGSGISIGHPVGMTGARIIIAAINELKRRGGRYACATMCASGGPACDLLWKISNKIT